jgi:hypothetical protein
MSVRLNPPSSLAGAFAPDFWGAPGAAGGGAGAHSCTGLGAVSDAVTYAAPSAVYVIAWPFFSSGNGVWCGFAVFSVVGMSPVTVHS